MIGEKTAPMIFVHHKSNMKLGPAMTSRRSRPHVKPSVVKISGDKEGNAGEKND
jgi:hypothetical protein